MAVPSDMTYYLSGLADPGPIASIFWMDDELGSDIYLDGIVTLVDAKYISEVSICVEDTLQLAEIDTRSI